MNLFNRKLIPKLFAEDLNNVKDSVMKLRIHGNARNLDRLATFSKLDELSVYALNQEQLDTICKYARPRSLKLYELRLTDLSPLSQLSTLEELNIDWNTKVYALWDMAGNKRLRKLTINDFSKLNDISALKISLSLTELGLSGGMWNKLKLRSLEPLRTLTSLEKLSLANLSVENGGLEPLTNLSNLNELTLSNQFPTEEYARLSVALPSTHCEYFAPYVIVKGIYPDKDVMPVGKGKPFLSSKRDESRLLKLASDFAAMQDKYRKQ